MQGALPQDFKEVVALVFIVFSVFAGGLMMWLGYRLTKGQEKLRNTLHTAIYDVHSAVYPSSRIQNPSQPRSSQENQDGPDDPQQPAIHNTGGAAEYVRALAELSANLSNLTPAIASFVVSTILFFIAGVAVGALILKLH